MNILITGASGGLGRALTNEFTARDCFVWGVARRGAEEIQFAHEGRGKRRYSQCDITNPDSVKKVVKDMFAAEFIPDVVILCAGAVFDDIDTGIDYDNFKENFNVNLFGAMNWVNEILPVFLTRDKGTFVAVSTLSVFRENHKNRIAYSASKSALSTAFENLRLQYHSSGVNFVVVHPGQMSNEPSFIGITYDKAAKLIADRLVSGNVPHTVNFPLFQALLTRLARLIPDGIFYKYCMK